MAPGTQLWFQTHLSMWTSHQSVLPRLPQNTHTHPGRWRGAGCASPLGTAGLEEVTAGGACEPAQAGAPPSACRGKVWCMGKGAAMAAPLFAPHSTMVSFFYGGLVFFHKHSRLWSSLLQSLQAVSSQPTAISPMSLLFNPHVQAPAPVCTRHMSQAGAHRLWHRPSM